MIINVEKNKMELSPVNFELNQVLDFFGQELIALPEETKDIVSFYSKVINKYFTNCTPHAINVVFCGHVITFPPSGKIARVKTVYNKIDNENVVTCSYGEVENIPDYCPTKYVIVSAMVLGASTREDLVAPATGHPDCKRNDKGHILSVPCFQR